MDDDAVKIIDFGIVHLVGADSVTGLKGTLQYMAPEQIEMKPSSPASDIFSLAVVCYEALTGRKPFARKTDVETAEAIRQHIPPAICDLNPLGQPIGQPGHSQGDGQGSLASVFDGQGILRIAAKGAARAKLWSGSTGGKSSRESIGRRRHRRPGTISLRRRS